MRNLVTIAAMAIALAATPATAAKDMRHYPSFKGAPFSAAVAVGDILYLSGQIGQGADGKLVDGFEAQSKQTMENIGTTLKAAGLGWNDVFKCTVMIADMSRWGDFNKIYITYFKPDRLPARSAIGANGLAMGAAIEVECMAKLR